MSMTLSNRIIIVMVPVCVAVMAVSASGDPLTIFEIQTSMIDGDASTYEYSVVDCVGGIVVAKFAGYRPRLILQDPNHPDGWGAIQVKDWITADNFAMFQDAQVGDWIEFTNMYVEEFRGTTMLQRLSAYNPTYNIVTQGNPLPPPIIVSVADLPAPVYDPVEDGWFVETRVAEPYESMRIIVRDVSVTTMGLGKASDNYVLENSASESCWAADYMNEHCVGDYHPFVVLDQHFCAVSGLLEQYKNLGTGWDYYQLVTGTTEDLAICVDGTADGEIAMDDFVRFTECMTGPMCETEPDGCDPPAWTTPPVNRYIRDCLMMDLDYDGDVDSIDFVELQKILGGV